MKSVRVLFNIVAVTIALAAVVVLVSVLNQSRKTASVNRVVSRTVLPTVTSDEAGVQALKTSGADLSQATDIRHYVYFGDEDAARSAARILKAEGFRVIVQPQRAGGGQQQWFDIAFAHAVPSLDNIRQSRVEVQRLVAGFGGQYDGWEAAVVRKR